MRASDYLETRKFLCHDVSSGIGDAPHGSSGGSFLTPLLFSDRIIGASHRLLLFAVSVATIFSRPPVSAVLAPFC
jgi:hypothetical protein